MVFTMSLMLLVGTLFAGGKQETEAVSGSFTMGFSYMDTIYHYFLLMDAGAKDYCEEQGWELITHNQGGDETAMVTGCQDLLNQGVDALAISPCRPDSIGPILQAAKEKGVPVIIADIGTGGFDVDAFLFSNNIEGGGLVAEFMTEKFQAAGIEDTAEVGVIVQEPTNVAGQQRRKGFVDAVAAQDYLTIVGDVSIEKATAELAYPVAKDMISKNPDIAGIFACNDNMATGASQAAIDAGREDIIIIGFDGSEDALTSIEAGTMDGTILQYPYKFGQLSCELGYKIKNGESIEYDDSATNTIFMPVEMISIDNIDRAWAEIDRVK
jgi:ribose transport system substrate-binding protein